MSFGGRHAQPEYCDLSPHQIVPQPADQGTYVASEATMYRILREEALLSHREPSRPAVTWRPREHVATGPNQVFSWDITYLRTAVRAGLKTDWRIGSWVNRPQR